MPTYNAKYTEKCELADYIPFYMNRISPRLGISMSDALTMEGDLMGSKDIMDSFFRDEKTTNMVRLNVRVSFQAERSCFIKILSQLPGLFKFGRNCQAQLSMKSLSRRQLANRIAISLMYIFMVRVL